MLSLVAGVLKMCSLGSSLLSFLVAWFVCVLLGLSTKLRYLNIHNFLTCCYDVWVSLLLLSACTFVSVRSMASAMLELRYVFLISGSPFCIPSGPLVPILHV